MDKISNDKLTSNKQRDASQTLINKMRVSFRNLSLAQKIFAGFTIPLILMVGVSTAVYQSIYNLIDTDDWVLHTQEAISKGTRLDKLMLDMESAQRGYIITGKDNFLEPYHVARKKWSTQIKELKIFVSDNPSQVKLINEIEQQANTWIIKAALPTIKKRRLINQSKAKMEDLVLQVEKETGKILTDKIHASLQKFILAEKILIEQRTSDAVKASSTTIIITVLGTFISIIFAIIAAFVVSRYIAGTTQQLLSGTKEIAKGNFDIDIDISSKDELGELTLSFNKMVNDLKQANTELQQSTDKANAANRVKSEFLANMSHEIRTPMAGIIGMADMVLDSKLTQEQQEWMTSLKSSGKHLLQILNEILDQSKLEAGKITIDAVDFHFPSFISDITHGFQPILNEKGLQLSVDIDKNIPATINADSLRISQILTNLMSNAIKFTKSGTISIKATHTEEDDDNLRLSLSVSDSGIGLTADQQKKLFNAFTQADNSTSRKYGGTGLGLSICKKLAELMNGSIHVDSNIDVGSTFTFNVLCKKAKNEINASTHNKKEEKWVANKPLKILLAEDTLVMQIISMKILENLNHEVILAEDGKQAVELAETHNDIDLILMDIRMPNMDGLEATKIIRSKSNSINLPIIALTADITPNNIKEYSEIGIDAICSKPIDLPNLLKTINTILNEEIHTDLLNTFSPNDLSNSSKAI